MLRFRIGLGLAVGFLPLAFAQGREVTLGAGGIYTFATKWGDQYTIRCTTSPIPPTVLSTSCGCFESHERVGSNVHAYYHLRLVYLLSDGTVSSTNIAGFPSWDVCEEKRKSDYLNKCELKKN